MGPARGLRRKSGAAADAAAHAAPDQDAAAARARAAIGASVSLDDSDARVRGVCSLAHTLLCLCSELSKSIHF